MARIYCICARLFLQFQNANFDGFSIENGPAALMTKRRQPRPLLRQIHHLQPPEHYGAVEEPVRVGLRARRGASPSTVVATRLQGVVPEEAEAAEVAGARRLQGKILAKPSRQTARLAKWRVEEALTWVGGRV